MASANDVTVRSTPQAMTAIADLSAVISGPLLDDFEELRSLARTLTDPENWDGRSAAEFRTTVWPGYDRTLTDLHTQLDRLRSRLTEIQNDIQGAG